MVPQAAASSGDINDRSRQTGFFNSSTPRPGAGWRQQHKQALDAAACGPSVAGLYTLLSGSSHQQWLARGALATRSSCHHHQQQQEHTQHCLEDLTLEALLLPSCPLPSGDGYSGTDMVFYVTAQNGPTCRSSPALAYTLVCHLEPFTYRWVTRLVPHPPGMRCGQELGWYELGGLAPQVEGRRGQGEAYMCRGSGESLPHSPAHRNRQVEAVP